MNIKYKYIAIYFNINKFFGYSAPITHDFTKIKIGPTIIKGYFYINMSLGSKKRLYCSNRDENFDCRSQKQCLHY